MPVRFVSTTLLVGLLFVLAACCGSLPCACNDGLADTLLLRFDRDSVSGSGFGLHELDTIQLIRRVKDVRIKPSADTVRLVRAATDTVRVIRLNTTTPFPRRDTLRASSYTYEVRLLQTTPVRTYTLADLRIGGALTADGCCTCYRNRRLALQLDGQPLDLTDYADGTRPGEVVLRK